MATKLDIPAMAKAIRAGERSALGRAITLIESQRPDHEEQAQELLALLLADSGTSWRIGITGVPGAGKSTTIDMLGSNLTAAGHKVAVLAVDPTSQRTGGSILGDKTRMAKLSLDRHAFIRPSPAGATLGGVARRTRESMLVCEAAGYDVIIVETVGIGQSETAVAEMVDFFLVLMVAGAGDDLQGIKKGVLEIADMIAINKADGDNIDRARRSAADYRGALNILMPVNPLWLPPVMTISALKNFRLDELWNEIIRHRTIMNDSGDLQTRRQQQQVGWMWSLLQERLYTGLQTTPGVKQRLAELEQQVRQGEITPTMAVKDILARVLALTDI